MQYKTVVGNWVIEEYPSILHVLKPLPANKDQSEQEKPAFKAIKEKHNSAIPGFIAISETKYLVADVQQYPKFHLLDMAAPTQEKLVEWSLKSPNTGLEAYSCSATVLAWVTRGSTAKIDLYQHLDYETDTLVHSVNMSSQNQPGRLTDIDGLARTLEPEYFSALASKQSRVLPLELFVHQQKIAVVSGVPMLGPAHRYILCFMVLTGSSAVPESHTVFAHSTHHLESPCKLPRCTWLTTSQIHSLYLAKDTSGFLFRHTNRKVILLSRWPRLEAISKVWTDTKTNSIQLRWSRTKRCLIVANRNYVDWSREGDLTYFELRL